MSTINSICTGCTSERAENELYLLAAGVPANCPHLYVASGREVNNLVTGLTSRLPMKHFIFIQAEVGNGKSSILRHIAKMSLKSDMAVTWLVPTILNGKPVDDLSAQAIAHLRMPGINDANPFLGEIALDDDFLDKISRIVQTNSERLYLSSTSLTNVFSCLSFASDFDFWGYHDWLRGLNVSRKDFEIRQEYRWNLFEPDVGHIRNVNRLPLYKTVSFLSALAYYCGNKGLTLLIDDLSGITLAKSWGYVSQIEAFWRKGWPFKYMGIHKRTRLNIVFAGSRKTALDLRIPARVAFSLPSNDSRSLKTLQNRIRRCASVAFGAKLCKGTNGGYSGFLPENNSSILQPIMRNKVTKMVRSHLFLGS